VLDISERLGLVRRHRKGIPGGDRSSHEVVIAVADSGQLGEAVPVLGRVSV
jgi:hypothetical protein